MNSEKWNFEIPKPSDLINFIKEGNVFIDIINQVKDYIISWKFLLQVSTILSTAFLLYLISRLVIKYTGKFLTGHDKLEKASAKNWLNFFIKNLFPILLALALYFIEKIFLKFNLWGEIFHFCATLIFAWIAINIITNLVKDTFFSKIISYLIWFVAILIVVHLFDPFIAILDSISFTIGKLRLSLYLVIKSLIVLAALLWGARNLSSFTQNIINSSKTLTPAVKVLLNKLINVTFLTAAVVIGLGSLGIDLTAFALFSGAVGVGVGFGLQKIVSNIVSGIILLVDNSIKPGDVIEVGNKYGWIESMNARYVSLRVWDGSEQLIPNEDMIANKVINWSHSNNLILVKVLFGVSYNSDLKLVQGLALKCTENVGRILKDPEPSCYLTEFGDSSVNFRLSFWINDPVNGLVNVKSEILFLLWNAFKENNIEIPFPQRDIHVRTMPELDNFSR